MMNGARFPRVHCPEAKSEHACTCKITDPEGNSCGLQLDTYRALMGHQTNGHKMKYILHIGAISNQCPSCM
eukprot:2647354-Pyramimonas_sp.AAC.1